MVFYHFGVPGIAGGFVGVDIFFVLSGFLIGGILWAELSETGRVSLTRFYLRRFKRLAPAFFTMAFLVAAASYLLLLPFEFREFGKTLIAATVYLSNVQFFRDSGYFDTGAEEKVLLHTWSLAVEEQFYVFLPLVLLLFRFSRKTLLTALVGMFALSLAACIWLTPTNPTATFYLFPFRAWELLAGVLLAIWGQSAGTRWAIHPGLSWLGLALVGYGLVFTTQAGFPGYQVAIPVLGTVLVLLNGHDPNPVNRVLSARMPVFVGLISYSLYLWHWPVAVLSTYARGAYAGWWETALWMVLSLLLSVLSWRYVELPVRRSWRLGFPATLGAVAALSVVALGLGGLFYKTGGMPARFPPDLRRHIDASAGFLQDWSRCSTPDDGPFAGVELCRIGPEGDTEVLFWGDSHLRAYMEGIALAAMESGTPGLLIWHAGCPPLFGVQKRESAATPAQDADCARDNETIRRALPMLPHLRAITLVGRWAYYADGAGTGRDAHNRITLLPDTGDQPARFTMALHRTVSELAGSAPAVMVLRQTPEIPWYDSRTTARALAHGREEAVADTFQAPLDTVNQRAASSDPVLQTLAAEGKITVLDPRARLCGADSCSVLQDGLVYYFDNNHLNNDGARALRDLFLPALTVGAGE